MEITPTALHGRLQHPDPPLLLDVREAWEFGICHLKGARLIPLAALPANLDSLEAEREREIVTVCHHGMRSLQAAIWLKSQGFPVVQSLKGGMDAWARTIDTTVATY